MENIGKINERPSAFLFQSLESARSALPRSTARKAAGVEKILRVRLAVWRRFDYTVDVESSKRGAFSGLASSGGRPTKRILTVAARSERSEKCERSR